MRSLLALALVLGGCSLELDDDHELPVVDHPPPDELATYPTIGKDNRVGFDLEQGKADRVIGELATAQLIGFSRGSAPDVATVTSDDPSILTVTSTQITNNFFPRTATVTIHAEGAGDTDIVFREASGAEIDRVTLHARAADKIDIDRVWGAGSVRVLAGAVQRIQVTTSIKGVRTLGTGSVELSFDGGLAAAAGTIPPQFESAGDEAFFTATSDGVITAEVPGVTRTFNAIAVQPSELTEVTREPHALDVAAGEEGIVEVGALAGAGPVYGALCTWTAAPGLTIGVKRATFVGWIGADAAFAYGFNGTAGTYVATCTLPGGLTTTVNVTLH